MNQDEIIAALRRQIFEYRRLAQLAADNPHKQYVLGDNAAVFYGTAEGLHRALMLVDRETGMSLPEFPKPTVKII